jgi:hypothetical protein
MFLAMYVIDSQPERAANCGVGNCATNRPCAQRKAGWSPIGDWYVARSLNAGVDQSRLLTIGPRPRDDETEGDHGSTTCHPQIA